MANNTNKNNKNNKAFFKDFKNELKKVTWPTPKQVLNSTTGVIIVVIITAIIVFVLDFAFEGLNKYGVNKLKDMIATTSENELVEDQNNTTDGNTVADETDENNTTEDNTTSEDSEENTNNTTSESNE